MVFVKGASGNPGGRPKSKPITEEIRRQLEAIARGSSKNNLSLVIEALVATAKMRGTSESVAAVKLMLAYVEGSPTQTIDVNVMVQEAAERIAAELGIEVAEVIAEAERIVGART